MSLPIPVSPKRFWLGAALVAATVLGSAPTLAAQTDITIAMDPPPAAPRINGPRVIGWRPGTPFLHTIAATGQAPLTFAATGLPSGLSLDENSGVISGTAPAEGSYPVDITVSNATGSARATITLVVGDTLALTPPMGWNSYDSFYENVTESDVLAAAGAMQEVLQPFGWNTVVIDYLWYDPENAIDEYGRLLPSASKYPNSNGADGFTPIADQVHALGLRFGIHLMRGIPRNAFSANTPILDSTYTAQQAGNSNDACPWDDHMWGVHGDTAAGQAWYDSIYAQYADWGVDFVKVDDMMNPYGGNALHDAEVVAVHDALFNTNRSIVFSLSPGPNQTSDTQVLNANVNMWRTVNDFWDTNGLSTMDDEFAASYAWSEAEGITPGHWPDADMLPLGVVGSRQSAFTHNQQVTVMTLWSMMPSPLMFGGQPTRLQGDDWTIALLTNDEVLAVNQDALASRGKRVAQQGSTEVWARDLSHGRKAVALFNRGAQDATIAISLSALGVTDTVVVRDLWHKQDVDGVTDEISANVPHEGALMYTLSPPGVGIDGTDEGAGGAGPVAAGGTGGNGGTTNVGPGGAGGTLGVGGTSGVAGSSGIAGSGGGTAGTPPTITPSSPTPTPSAPADGPSPTTTGTAGSPIAGAPTTVTSASPIAGTPGGGAPGNAPGVAGGNANPSPVGSAGAATVDAATSGDDAGCSCRLGRRNPSSNAGWWLAGVLLFPLVARRRRATCSP